jgi:hypothetical protein
MRQKTIVKILYGKRDSTGSVDELYIPRDNLESWTIEEPSVAFHYHAFTLYIALLLNDQPVALSAIAKCRTTSYAVEGIPRLGDNE